MSVALKPRLDVDTQTGHHDRFTHYVYSGAPGVLSFAYCGKEWIPERFYEPGDTVCATCAEVAARKP